MIIRRFSKKDTSSLISLFQRAVHIICRTDYSSEQLDAWAPHDIDPVSWHNRLSQNYTILAQEDSKILGFASLGDEGCIDMLYVDADCLGQGIASTLLEQLEDQARDRGLKQIYSDVSITAHLFFLQGFVVQKEYIKVKGQIEFKNTLMRKIISFQSNHQRL